MTTSDSDLKMGNVRLIQDTTSPLDKDLVESKGSVFNSPKARRVRVLHLDDNPGDVCLVQLALSHAEVDCDLTVIGDGAEALEFVRHQGKFSMRQPPDLIVLDLHLPKHDGLEILQALGRHPEFGNVPVAILTSGASPPVIEQISQCQIARFIEKPSVLEDFLEIGTTLKAMLAERQARSQSSSRET